MADKFARHIIVAGNVLPWPGAPRCPAPRTILMHLHHFCFMPESN